MPTPHRQLALLAPLALCAAAHAGEGPFIEIRVAACGDDPDQDAPGYVEATFVVDASAPVSDTSPVGLTFELADAEYRAAPGPVCGQAFLTPTNELGLADFEEATLFYSTHSQLITLNLADDTAGGLVDVTMLIGAVGADFHPDIDTPPDDPGAYTPVDPGNTIALDADGLDVQIRVAWEDGIGFIDGDIRVTARQVEAPAPGCSPVDLAEPFGVLNFSDVFAFLAAFGAGCP